MPAKKLILAIFLGQPSEQQQMPILGPNIFNMQLDCAGFHVDLKVLTVSIPPNIDGDRTGRGKSRLLDPALDLQASTHLFKVPPHNLSVHDLPFLRKLFV